MSTDKDPLLRAIAVVVRRRRLARRLTVEGLARKQPFTASYVYKVEHGLTNATVLKLAALAKALDIDLEQLFGEAEWEAYAAQRDPAEAAQAAGP